MDDSEDGVGPDEVPRIDRSAAVFGVAGQPERIDRGSSTVDATGSAAV
jgi:hypothetical protein